MNKLRAIEYLLRTAELGSFAAAARALEVSTPAVTQLIAGLEANLGAPLFHRTTRGLHLTPDGERYAEAARQALDHLNLAERSIGPRGAALRGSLHVGVRHGLGQHVVMPVLPRFMQRHPAVELHLHPVVGYDEFEALALDVAFLVGWRDALPGHLVGRILGGTRLMVCAAPAYLARAGTPSEPMQLATHECLVSRSSGRTLLDRWLFARPGPPATKPVSVDVRARLFSDDTAWLIEAACAGAGILRHVHLVLESSVASGALVPLLEDWVALEPPTIFAVFRPQHRRSRLLRALVDHVAAAVGARAAGAAIAQAAPPEWYGRVRGRQSSVRRGPT